MAGLWDWFSSGQAAQPAPVEAPPPASTDKWTFGERLSKAKKGLTSGEASTMLRALFDFATHPNAKDLAPYMQENMPSPDEMGSAAKGALATAAPAVGLPLYIADKFMADPLFWQGASGEKEPFVPPQQTADAGAAPSSPTLPPPAPISSAPAPSVPMPRPQPSGVTPPSYMRPALVSSAAAAEPEAAPVGPPRVLSPSAPAETAPEPSAAPAGYQQSPQMKELFDLLLGSVKKAQQPRSKWDDLASAGVAAGAGILANSRKSTGEAIGLGVGQGLQQYNLNERQRIADSASANETAARLMSVLTGQENAQLQREALAQYRNESLAGKSEDRAIRKDANERMKRKDESDEEYRKRMLAMEERRVAADEKRAIATSESADPAQVKTAKWLMNQMGMDKDQALQLSFMARENPAKYYHEVATKLVDLGVVKNYAEGREYAKRQYAEDSALGVGGPISSNAAKELTPEIVQKKYPNARYQRIKQNGKEFDAWVNYGPDGNPTGLISADEFK